MVLTSINSRAGASSTTTTGDGNSALIAVKTAQAQIGKPYQWGGVGPNTFDCSGLTQYAYHAAGIAIPAYTGAQILLGTSIPTSNPSAWQAGDLVFPDPGHVQMVVSPGKTLSAVVIVEAPRTGEDVIQRTEWAGSVVAVRRLVSGSTVVAPASTTQATDTSIVSDLDGSAEINTVKSWGRPLAGYGMMVGGGLLILSSIVLVNKGSIASLAAIVK
jgi:cell wall-associated NlpC family hydrolase